MALVGNLDHLEKECLSGAHFAISEESSHSKAVGILRDFVI